MSNRIKLSIDGNNKPQERKSSDWIVVPAPGLASRLKAEVEKAKEAVGIAVLAL